MCNIHCEAMDHGAIHSQSEQNRRGEEDRLFRETLRMRAFPKTATRDDHHVTDPFSAALLSPFVPAIYTCGCRCPREEIRAPDWGCGIGKGIFMTTFMDVIGSQSCPRPFGGILCESYSFARPVISQGITFIV